MMADHAVKDDFRAPPVSAHLVEEVQRAVRRVFAAVKDKQITEEVAVARVARLAIGFAGDLGASAGRKRRDYAWGMARMAKIDPTGKSCHAARDVAKEMATDRRDPAEVNVIAQCLRKLRRASKRNNEPGSFIA